MAKNIVICCDGTDNMLTIDKNTNVLYLYSCLEKNNSQIAYYNPGVGTITKNKIKNEIVRTFHTIKDAISAGSLEDNVKNAYYFLMDNYEDGDEVYMFGFSRGAYTVRMLAGLIEMFGLLHKGNNNHLRYALELFVFDKDMFAIGNSFKYKFSRNIKIKFLGIWDTVVAVGGLFNFTKSFPYSRQLNIVKTIRHAVSIDERRKHYKLYEVNPIHPDLLEVYFSGVHSDVGGSYKEEESGLSKIAFEWMLGEASNNGLQLNKKNVNKYLYGKDPQYTKPNYFQKIHNSLTAIHIISDFIPRPRFKKDSWFFEIWIDFRLWPRRFIPPKAKVHDSVFKKIRSSNGNKYQPKNIKSIDNYDIIENKKIIMS